MDLVYLNRRHKVSLIRAEGAGSRAAQLVHARLALGYARLIENAQRVAIAPAAGA